MRHSDQGSRVRAIPCGCSVDTAIARHAIDFTIMNMQSSLTFASRTITRLFGGRALPRPHQGHHMLPMDNTRRWTCFQAHHCATTMAASTRHGLGAPSWGTVVTPHPVCSDIHGDVPDKLDISRNSQVRHARLEYMLYLRGTMDSCTVTSLPVALLFGVYTFGNRILSYCAS